MSFVESVCQPSTLRMLIWPEASNAQNSIAAVSAYGSTGCVLILRLNSSCSRSIAFVVRATGEGEEPVAGFREAGGDGAVIVNFFADEVLTAPPALIMGLRIDQV